MKPFKRLLIGSLCAATLGSCDDSPDALATYNGNGQTQDETIELTEGESRVLGIMSHGGTRRSQCEAEDIAVNFTTSPDGDNRALRYVGNCHAWLVDGYLIQEEKTTLYKRINHYSPRRYIETVRIGDSVKYRKYLHNNWGWSSYGNGFYAEGVFDTKAKASESDGKDIIDTAENNGGLQYHLTVYPNIRKQ